MSNEATELRLALNELRVLNKQLSLMADRVTLLERQLTKQPWIALARHILSTEEGVGDIQMKHIIAAMLLTLPLTAAAQDVRYVCKGEGSAGTIAVGMYEMVGMADMWIGDGSFLIGADILQRPSGVLRRWIAPLPGKSYGVLTVNTVNKSMQFVLVSDDETKTYYGECEETYL